MKKQLLAAMAATAVLGVTTAFAANPFSDVTPQDWAYQSVSQLAAAGVINGYPDGTFRGQNNITRYEMAQMVAKAMANQNRANAEQQAMINRLADEFSAELNNLGVRVGNLEKKVGNVKITGDARLRYSGSDDSQALLAYNLKKDSKFDYRGRIAFNATVNDTTTAMVRVTTNDVEFGNATGNSVQFDRMFVNHKFGSNADLSLGRFGLTIGQGLLYNDEPFDGAGLNLHSDKLTLNAAYGQMTSLYGAAFPADLGDKRTKLTTMAEGTIANPSLALVQLRAQLAKATELDAYYIFGGKNFDTDVYGFALNAKLAEKVWVGGEWAKATDWNQSQIWTAGLGYGNYNQAVKGTWDVKVQYFNEGVNAPVFNTRWAAGYNQNYKGWLATVDYALYKNVGLVGYYGFSNKDQAGNKLNDFYRAELNYRF